MKRILCAAALALLCSVCFAAVPLDRATGQTLIAPAYFGPYAYPVPDMNDGTLKSTIYAEVSCDGVVGHISADNPDYTLCPTFRLAFPLWTDRANFVIYGEMHEFYWSNPEVQALRRVSSELPTTDNDSGNLYYGVEMLVLREGALWPSVVLAAYTQSASGYYYDSARHYDCAGYHFTLSAGKSFGGFRVAAMGGFLCWQTANGRQNDAWLAAAKASYSKDWFSVSAEYGTYHGWEHMGDCPSTVKLRAELHFGHFAPFAYYAHGIADWPFDQLRIGVAYNL